MSNNLFDTNVKYVPGQNHVWTGRATNPNLENQYWYQEVMCYDFNHLNQKNQADVGIIGYVCDEGVRRNMGRVGAKDGPMGIRGKLGKLPVHFKAKSIADFGDVVCIGEDLEFCQQAFSNYISILINKNIFPIALGGGHDIAYAHYKGLKNALPKKRIGIINFDAHFDLRPLETQPNSGTPFNQILSEYQHKEEHLDYFAIGIQKQSNAKQLFEIAYQYNVDFVFNDACQAIPEHINSLKKQLEPIINNNDFLYFSIDMDGFSSAYAPGVSAPSPLGFSPLFVYEILKFLLATNKVISCDITELNPKFDRDEQTAVLASRLVDMIVTNYNN